MSLLPFIQERLAVVEKDIKTDLFLWLCGKKHPHLEFSGTIESFYWESYLENNVYKIIQAAFNANRELSCEHSVNPIISISDAERASKQTIIKILSVMVDYDQSMRSDGHQSKVKKKDIKEIKKRCLKEVEERAQNEANLLKMPKNDTVNIPLPSECGIYWYVKNCHFSVHLKLIGLGLTCLAIGFGAGKNETMRSLHNAFTNTESTKETVSTKSRAAIPIATVQNIHNTITETQKIESSKNDRSE